MVDEINFPKGPPPVAAPGRVQKVNRKKREQQKPPFEKFLDPQGQKDKKKKKKNETDTVDLLAKPKRIQKSETTEPSRQGDLTEAEEDSEKKIIDVRV